MNTRFTMLFSFVLWCLFESSVQCANRLPEDRDSLLNVALSMQNVDTGYPDEPYTENVIKNSDIDSLRKIIKAKVDRLYCRYMFSVMDHMDSTRTIFHHQMRDEQIECIASFKEVVPDMIGTLYGLGDKEFEGLWLFNVYVNELPKYFKSITSRDRPMTVELADMLSNVHRVVTRYVLYATHKRFCTDHKKVITTSSQSQSAACFANLNTIKTLMANNREHGVVADNSKNSFTPAQLYLNDVVVDKLLMAGLRLFVSDLQIDWSTLYVWLTELNAKAHGFISLGQGTRSIDSYHDLLFDFVELVILRFVRKHVLLSMNELNDGRVLTDKLFVLTSLPNEADNATMSTQTAAMMRLFRIDNHSLNEIRIMMLWKSIKMNNWKAMEIAGRKEEERIINKYNGRVNATQIKLNQSVGLEIFQRVLKLALSHDITTTNATPDLEKNTFSPIQMNIITMDITYKYFANVLFKDVDFGVLDLFHNRKKNYI